MFTKVLFSAACLLAMINSVKLGCDGGCGCGCEQEHHCDDPITQYEEEVATLEVADRTAKEQIEESFGEMLANGEITQDEYDAFVDQQREGNFEALFEAEQDDPEFFDTMVHDVAESEMAHEILDEYAVL